MNIFIKLINKIKEIFNHKNKLLLESTNIENTTNIETNDISEGNKFEETTNVEEVSKENEKKKLSAEEEVIRDMFSLSPELLAKIDRYKKTCEKIKEKELELQKIQKLNENKKAKLGSNS